MLGVGRLCIAWLGELLLSLTARFELIISLRILGVSHGASLTLLAWYLSHTTVRLGSLSCYALPLWLISPIIVLCGSREGVVSALNTAGHSGLPSVISLETRVGSSATSSRSCSLLGSLRPRSLGRPGLINGDTLSIGLVLRSISTDVP